MGDVEWAVTVIDSQKQSTLNNGWVWR